MHHRDEGLHHHYGSCRHHRLGLYVGRQHRGLLLHLLGPTGQVVHDRHSSLWQYEELLLLAQLPSTVSTLKLVIARIGQRSTDMCLDVPVAGDGPRVAVVGTDGPQITLAALMAQRLPHAKREFHVGYIIMAVNKVDAEEMMHIHRVGPIAHIGRHQQVLPLAGLHVVGRPGTIASVDSHRPVGSQPHSHPQVGCQPGIVEQIVTECYLLSPYLCRCQE